MISIHTPREGSDERIEGAIDAVTDISIHTPREGSDVTLPMVFRMPETFQSTLPVRGVTMEHPIAPDTGWISIHTPREGSDSKIH